MGPQKTDKGIRLANIALQAKHSDRSILVNESGISSQAIFLIEITRTIVGSHEQTKRVSAELSGQLNGHIGIDYCACVYGLNLRAKNIYPFKKEGTLLFEEDGKALVSSDDQLI